LRRDRRKDLHRGGRHRAGHPPEFRERVFERFFRLPAASSPGGGLGLPIVREIARGFGGRVDILTPVSRKGALLRVTLPPVAPDA
jgi:signal transduction histidine kinase